MNNRKKKAAVALSGGVDSAAAAFILKESGYDVFGITMNLFENFDVESSRYVAEKLNIDHYVMDYSRQFKREIIDKFTYEYFQGRTPNPCILCNSKMKYGLLLQEAKKLGADFLASGHYANIIYDEEDCKYHLLKGKAERKDQSYFLYHLNQDKLSSIILPLSQYENKQDVRKLVKDIIPETSQKKDSQNICFIQNMNHNEYIKSYSNTVSSKGNFIDINGKFLGYHKGIYNYTIGQRRGIGINNENNLFVVNINAEKNEITLGKDKDTYKREIKLKNVSFTNEINQNKKSFNCEIKLCQWGYFIKSTVYNLDNNSALVEFFKEERAPAPGQSAVFYDGDEVLGGGIIV